MSRACVAFGCLSRLIQSRARTYAKLLIKVNACDPPLLSPGRVSWRTNRHRALQRERAYCLPPVTSLDAFLFHRRSCANLVGGHHESLTAPGPGNLIFVESAVFVALQRCWLLLAIAYRADNRFMLVTRDISSIFFYLLPVDALKLFEEREAVCTGYNLKQSKYYV